MTSPSRFQHDSRASRPRQVGALVVAAATALALTACTASTPGAKPAPAATEPPPPLAPHPFGRLDCKARYGVRFCQGDGTTERVPSFDGVPLDADVTLPAHGRGPFPLIVMLHGLGGNKTNFDSTRDDGRIDNVTFASRGWAVLTYTARGFGNSCGTAASRAGTPACKKGWIHLADQRYEVRDTQYLAGLLVDEGLVKPTIAVTGDSYGAGQSLELAMLKNRVRLENGTLVAWVSPVHHVPMSIGAVYAEWGWDDLASSLVPNGDLLTNTYTPPSADLDPVGVEKLSWDSLLYSATTLFYLAPRGADPSADLTGWFHAIDAGEPYSAASQADLRQLEEYHSPAGIPMPSGGPPPTVLQNGWTDTLFPVSEALHYAERYRADHVASPILEIFDDVGHGWAQDKAADVATQTALAIRFLDDVMLEHAAPPTGIVAIGTTCPSSAPSRPTLRGASLSALETGSVDFSTARGATPQVVTSSGGSPGVAADLNPAYHSPYCQQLTAQREPGTASYVVERPHRSATTLIGPYQVTARLTVRGDYPELVGRLWDENPASGTRQLVEAGVVRPDVSQEGGVSPGAVAETTVTFELSPNLWTLPAGHELVLELLGSSSPWFRPSNGTFSVGVTKLEGSIPTH
jgi:acetyl esterase/lipase